MKMISRLFSFIFLGMVFAILFLLRYRFPDLSMPGYQVLLFSLSIAFTWVEIVLKGGAGYIKPLGCTKCLTGWIALILAFIFHVDYWFFYLPSGAMVGAIYSAIKMRYL